MEEPEDRPIYVFMLSDETYGGMIHTVAFSDEDESELYTVLFLREHYPEVIDYMTAHNLPTDTFDELARGWPESFMIDWEIYIMTVHPTSADARLEDAQMLRGDDEN